MEGVCYKQLVTKKLVCPLRNCAISGAQHWSCCWQQQELAQSWWVEAPTQPPSLLPWLLSSQVHCSSTGWLRMEAGWHQLAKSACLSSVLCLFQGACDNVQSGELILGIHSYRLIHIPSPDLLPSPPILLFLAPDLQWIHSPLSVSPCISLPLNVALYIQNMWPGDCSKLCLLGGFPPHCPSGPSLGGLAYAAVHLQHTVTHQIDQLWTKLSFFPPVICSWVWAHGEALVQQIWVMWKPGPSHMGLLVPCGPAGVRFQMDHFHLMMNSWTSQVW